MSLWPYTTTPKSQGNAFDWRTTYALVPTKFAADPSHRTPLYSKWCQTEMSVPWPKYRKAREAEAKKERRVHGVTAGGHASLALGPLSERDKKRYAESQKPRSTKQ